MFETPWNKKDLEKAVEIADQLYPISELDEAIEQYRNPNSEDRWS